MGHHSYVAGPNIAKGAECDADVLKLRQSVCISTARQRPASAGAAGALSQQHHQQQGCWQQGAQNSSSKSPVKRSSAFVTSTDKPFGSPWVSSQQHSSSPLITVNAALAPEWTTALDIGRQVVSGNPFPGLPTGKVELLRHMPAASGIAGRGQAGTISLLYQPPVQLVVLPSALQRLGPSAPWRYTAGQLATMHMEGQQPHLSPGPTRLPPWTFDAATQTAPAELQPDWEAMHKDTAAAGAAAVAAAATGVSAQERPCSSPAAVLCNAAAAAAAAIPAKRQPGSVKALTCNPWQLTFRQDSICNSPKHIQQQQQQPWVPPSYRDAADCTIAAAEAADAAAAVKDAAGSKRQQSPPADKAAAAALAAAKAAAGARRSAAVKFAALGRRAAVVRAEGLAAAAAAAEAAADIDGGSSYGDNCCCCAGTATGTVVCIVDPPPPAAAAAAAEGGCCGECCGSCEEGESARGVDSSPDESSGGSEYLPCCDESSGFDDIHAGLAELLAEVSEECSRCTGGCERC